MIFRDVAEQSKRKEALDLPYTQVVFIGFNAITEAEKYSWNIYATSA